MKGKLIVLDGGDGSGKGTQTKLLVERLKKEGFDVVTHSFPTYGHPATVGVELYLNGEFGLSASDVSPKIASIFFAIDRNVVAKEKITPALEAGKIVILDRYVSSNGGHQGGKIAETEQRKEYLDWLNDVEFERMKLPRPNANIFLQVHPVVSQQLVNKKAARDYLNGKKSDIHEADVDHLYNSQHAFLYMAEIQPNWHIIKCNKPDQSEEMLANFDTPPEEKMRSIEEIHEDIYKIVKKIIEN